MLAALASLLSLAAGCRDDGASYRFNDGQGINVDAASTALQIRNNTLETVYFMAVERQTTILIDWIPWCDSSNAVRVNETRTIPYTMIAGYAPKSQIVVYLWNGTHTTPPVIQDGSLRTLTVSTP